jgi:uncharacterized protein
MSKALFRFRSPIYLVIFGLSSAAAFAAPNASFSCSKRTSPDEKAICQDQRLTTLDQIANQGYLFLRAKLGKAQANKINLPLIRQRQKCKSDIVCIEKAQRESIRIFNQNGAMLVIPPLLADEAMKSELAGPANQPAVSPEPVAPVAPAPSSETVMGSGNATTESPETAPADAPARLSDPSTAPDKTPAQSDEIAAAATPAPPPSPTTPVAESKSAEAAVAPQEPIDQPPAETQGTTAANDNEPSQDAAGAVAEATPEPKGSREWRPEIEKEIRAESELESSATDTLTEEMAELEQIKPLSRQQREALVTTRSRHRTAFMLATILFALVVAYAFSKFRRDPGLTATPSKPVKSAASPEVALYNPPTPLTEPPVAQRTPPTVSPVRETARASGVPEPAVPTRPIISTASAQQPPRAWVWSQYKGKV